MIKSGVRPTIRGMANSQSGSKSGRAAIDAEIQAQRARGEPLGEQLLWRIKALGADVDIGDPANQDAFREVWSAFNLPGTTLDAAAGECRATLDDGGTILVKAFIYHGGNVLGFVQRRLLLGRAIVIHEGLVIEPPYRGRGLNLALLNQSFDFYDEVGIREVWLEAGLATGRWHWARVGFEFAQPKDLQAVKDWVEKVLKAVGIRGLRVDRYTSALQFARMGGNRQIALETIAAAIPASRERIEAAAAGNDLEMDQPIALARAVMITGPTWLGRLDLQGPGRAVFRAHLQEKAARIKRNAS